MVGPAGGLDQEVAALEVDGGPVEGELVGGGQQCGDKRLEAGALLLVASASG